VKTLTHIHTICNEEREREREKEKRRRRSSLFPIENHHISIC